jgi:hypothetical protein
MFGIKKSFSFAPKKLNGFQTNSPRRPFKGWPFRSWNPRHLPLRSSSSPTTSHPDRRRDDAEAAEIYVFFFVATDALQCCYGSFTLAKFVSKTIGNSDTQQYLPWPPWVARHKNRNDPICVAPPKEAKQVSKVILHCDITLNFVNVNTALWSSLRHWRLGKVSYPRTFYTLCE